MFRTELSLAPDPQQLPRTARVLTVGSCFADSIGTQLAAHKVEALINPFGTVFQPLALGRLLRAAAGEDVDWQQHVVEARGRWQSYDLHGSIGADSPVALLQTIQELVRRAGEFLRNADAVLVTLGTAWAYRLRETGEMVNNCHKQPAELFVRELLTPDDIINSLAETHAYLRRINPRLRFVLTVSPVRHLRDTLPLNAVSKSVLRVAAHFVSELLPDVAYFPAYELLLDDLRDYRFYGADMLHPSEVAEDYVWDKFARTYFDAEFGRFRKEWAAVRQALGHRPLHAGAPEHRQFLQSTLEKLEQLSLRQVAVADELREVRTRLAALPVLERPVASAAVEDEDGEERIDVGTDSTEDAAKALEDQVAVPPTAEGRPPRLSPEEFLAQRAARPSRPERGRREGRGRKNQEPANESEQLQGTAGVDDRPGTQDFTVLASVDGGMRKREEKLATVPAALEGEATEGEELIKKKKRRSRGGAKRTARKNALRLAADEGLPGAGTNATPAAEASRVAPAENQDVHPEVPKATVIIESGPAERGRGGRRNEPGRAPQMASVAENEGVPNEVLASATPAALAVTTSQTTPAPAEAVVALANPRNGRNRNSRGTNKAAAGAQAPDAASTTAVPSETTAHAGASNAAAAPGSPQPLAEAAGEGNKGREQASSPVQPSEPQTLKAPAARQSNRAKRMVSAARAEKPAVDTPVVPVPDALRVRTQVAAGRMTGSSASLVVPPAPKAAASKAAPAKKAAVPKEVVAPAGSLKASGPVPKSKPTAKPKVTTPKAATAKAPAAKPVTAKASANKLTPAKSTAPKPAVPKPKTRKKPAKPA